MLRLPAHPQDGQQWTKERRTTGNLSIHPRRGRPRVFINTGFLTAPSTEIHTAMEVRADGPQEGHGSPRPGSRAYEDRNVDVGLIAAAGKAQIGKGMWAAPDRMTDCSPKAAHPMAGANTPVSFTHRRNLCAPLSRRPDRLASAGDRARRPKRPADILGDPGIAPHWTP